MSEIHERFKQIGLIPIVSLEDTGLAEPLAHALQEGGVPIMEITFQTPNATEAIRRVASALSDLLVGAGMVLTLHQAKAALDAGAQFIVTPGFSPFIIDYCLQEQVPVFPGAATPTEITRVLEKGLHGLNFFPAEALGGPAALQALSGPFQSIRFIPTGGITMENLTGYLSLPSVLACGGSWLARREDIQAGRFETITQTTRDAAAIVAHLRGRAQVS
jgi:2-dehydro-3-deoxyphosphogluconate aldolase / (4S)-4-hydroxy-2-oxoglutarate aldolase